MIKCLRRCLSVVAVGSVGLMVLASAGPALAQMGDVSVGGVWVCRLARGIGQLSLEERMAEIERRIGHVLSAPRHRGVGVGVIVRAVGQDAEIIVGDTSIMTITVADVADTRMRTTEVARQWAARLVKGMNQALPDPTFHVF